MTASLRWASLGQVPDPIGFLSDYASGGRRLRIFRLLPMLRLLRGANGGLWEGLGFPELTAAMSSAAAGIAPGDDEGVRLIAAFEERDDALGSWYWLSNRMCFAASSSEAFGYARYKDDDSILADLLDDYYPQKSAPFKVVVSQWAIVDDVFFGLRPMIGDVEGGTLSGAIAAAWGYAFGGGSLDLSPLMPAADALEEAGKIRMASRIREVAMRGHPKLKWIP